MPFSESLSSYADHLYDQKADRMAEREVLGAPNGQEVFYKGARCKKVATRGRRILVEQLNGTTEWTPARWVTLI